MRPTEKHYTPDTVFKGVRAHALIGPSATTALAVSTVQYEYVNVVECISMKPRNNFAKLTHYVLVLQQ